MKFIAKPHNILLFTSGMPGMGGMPGMPGGMPGMEGTWIQGDHEESAQERPFLRYMS